MNREKILNWIGLSILAGATLFAAVRVLTNAAEERDPSLKIIRISHSQLESGYREAVDAVAKEYMKLHPNVRVEQSPIPERIYPNWMLTQLVGGTAPDLLALPGTISEERSRRHLEPLNKWVDEPNPYNAGTPLEGLPWRNTFIDGLEASANAQGERFGVPMTIFTQRVYYNRSLYREITGGEVLPKTHAEFMALCKQVQEYSDKHDAKMVPLAGSKTNPGTGAQVYGVVTQTLLQRLNHLYHLKYEHEIGQLAYLRGDYSFESPELEAALQVLADSGRVMQPGFRQLSREDAVFYFIQKRALMIVAGSWDVKSLTEEAPFEVGIFPIPVPDRKDPEYGSFVMGPTSEAGAQIGAGFSLNHDSKHLDVAVDFLRFMTSYRASKIFSDVSFWLPSVVGVNPPERIRPFMPETRGYPGGLPSPTDTGDAGMLFEQNYHLLFGTGSVEKFRAAVAPGYGKAMARDMARSVHSRKRSTAREDISEAALWFLNREQPDAPKGDLSILIQGKNEQEASTLWIQQELVRMGYPLNF